MISLLRQRLEALDSAIAEHQASLEDLTTQLPRLFLIESEYQLALQRAEAEWVRGVLKELTDGTFPGVGTWRRYHQTGEYPDEATTLAELRGKEDTADS